MSEEENKVAAPSSAQTAGGNVDSNASASPPAPPEEKPVDHRAPCLKHGMGF